MLGFNLKVEETKKEDTVTKKAENDEDKHYFSIFCDYRFHNSLRRVI